MRQNDVDRIVLALVEEWQNNPSKYRVGRGDVIRFTPMQVGAILSDLEIEPGLIRCKDCKCRDPEDKKCDCGIQWCAFPKKDDDFCSYAERREE